LTEAAEQTVYTFALTKTVRRIYVYRIESVPTLFSKLLHYWSYYVTYQTLSVKEIAISIECADALNSFKDDIMSKNIDDLVNGAICLDVPNCYECCQISV